MLKTKKKNSKKSVGKQEKKKKNESKNSPYNQYPKRTKKKIDHTHNDTVQIHIGEMAQPKFASVDDERAELADMNKGKEGAKFKYTNSMIKEIAILKLILDTTYRKCVGMVKKQIGEERTPDYSVLCRRVNKIDLLPSIYSIKIERKGMFVQLVPDGTGLSPSDYSFWRHHKYKTKLGFIRLSIMTSQETQEILAFRVTDEHTGDAPQCILMINDALVCLGIDPKKRRKEMEDMTKGGRGPNIEVEMRADGGYDSKEIFDYCESMRITPYIRIRNNAKCTSDENGRYLHTSRDCAILEQLGGHTTNPKEMDKISAEDRQKNRNKWKKQAGYSRRWLVEITFSTFKRMFGHSVKAITMQNIIHEIRLKIDIYNSVRRFSQHSATSSV